MPEAGESGSPTVRLPHSPRRTYRLVQALRAVAALMVVGHHATMLVEQRTYRTVTWYNGASGVDIFFVISGLVMTLTTARVARTGAGGWGFLKRRLERVVPLYWLATTAKVVGTLLAPGLAIHAIGTTRHVVASYLFLPSLGPGGTYEPTLVSGWTLNLEMMFYALIAAALAMGWGELAVAPVLLVLAGLGAAGVMPLRHAPSVWTDPVVLDFVWGMVLGSLVLRRVRLSQGAGWVGMVAGLGVLLLTPSMLVSLWRPVVWGVPATAIVLGAIALEERWGGRLPRGVLLLGDASYSIYLTHAFVLPLLGVGRWGERLLRPQLAWTVGVLGVVLSAGVGVVCYLVVELPILEWFRLRRGRPALG